MTVLVGEMAPLGDGIVRLRGMMAWDDGVGDGVGRRHGTMAWHNGKCMENDKPVIIKSGDTELQGAGPSTTLTAGFLLLCINVYMCIAFMVYCYCFMMFILYCYCFMAWEDGVG